MKDQWCSIVMIKWDRNIWEDELEMKISLQINKKKDFGEEEIYDNRPSSPY